MEIIEAPMFTKRILGILSDSEYRNLQWTLIANPLAGNVIQGGNGLRIIYYYLMKESKIYLVLVYTKNELDDLTTAQIKMLRDYVKKGVL